jgi:hypothetical protein
MVNKPGLYLHGFPDSYKELIEVTAIHPESFTYQYILSGNESAKYYGDQTWLASEAQKKSQMDVHSHPILERKKEVFDLIFGDIVMFNPRR